FSARLSSAVISDRPAFSRVASSWLKSTSGKSLLRPTDTLIAASLRTGETAITRRPWCSAAWRAPSSVPASSVSCTMPRPPSTAVTGNCNVRPGAVVGDGAVLVGAGGGAVLAEGHQAELAGGGGRLVDVGAAPGIRRDRLGQVRALPARLVRRRGAQGRQALLGG